MITTLTELREKIKELHPLQTEGFFSDILVDIDRIMIETDSNSELLELAKYRRNFLKTLEYAKENEEYERGAIYFGTVIFCSVATGIGLLSFKMYNWFLK